MKKILSSFLIGSFLSSLVLAASAGPALSAGSIYLSPGSSTVYGGTSFSVSVRINTGGGSVDAVQANLSYPADKLDFLGVSYGGSSFEIQAESSGGGGSVRMGRGSLSAKSGDLLIGTVTFRAKQSSGTAVVSFASGTEGVKAGKVVTSAGGGATYSFSEAPPPPKQDKTAPKISSIKVKNLSKTSATITWKTNEAATSTVEWGLTKKYGITTSASKLVKSHSVDLDKRLLLPTTTYHFRVKSKDGAGNAATSKDNTFKIPANQVKIKVVDVDGNPIVGAKVTLVSYGEATTDEEGVASFDDVLAEEVAVSVEYGGQTVFKVVSVEEKDDPQTFEVKVEGIAATKEEVLQIQDNPTLAIVILIVVLAVVGFMFKGKLLNLKKLVSKSHNEPKGKPHEEN